MRNENEVLYQEEKKEGLETRMKWKNSINRKEWFFDNRIEREWLTTKEAAMFLSILTSLENCYQVL